MRARSVPIEWPAGGAKVLHTMKSGAPVQLTPLLVPIELAYRATMALRNLGYDSGLLKTHRVAAPVISVGNLVAGGAGKTPVTRYLTDQLVARGRRPAILHGGYGSDEARLHSEWHPDIVVLAGKDRVAAARQALVRGADVILLDDAFQHRRLARDLDIVLLAAESTNLRMIPAGPARETLDQVKRADFIIITRKVAPTENAAVLETRAHQIAPGIPTARLHLRIRDDVPRDAVVAVASVARPDVFLEQLMQLGVPVLHLLAYPDHYDYTAADIEHIRRRAQNHLVVTTAKDAVKLRPLMPEQPLHVVQQELVFESGEGELMQRLDSIL
jgi:tetraacyldisaccharide 4'-kinase